MDAKRWLWIFTLLASLVLVVIGSIWLRHDLIARAYLAKVDGLCGEADRNIAALRAAPTDLTGYLEAVRGVLVEYSQKIQAVQGPPGLRRRVAAISDSWRAQLPALDTAVAAAQRGDIGGLRQALRSKFAGSPPYGDPAFRSLPDCVGRSS
jgi:hypothetical protein